MNSLALRVAARFMRADAEESEKGGVPARWQEWLKAVHEGGKQKIPNPNPETKDRFRDVSYSTALKDKKVFQVAIKEYREWVKKNPEKKDGAPKEPAKEDEESKDTKTSPESESGSSKTPKLELKGPLAITDADLDKIIEKHKKAFDEIAKDMKDEVEAYSKKYGKEDYKGEKVPEFAIKEFESLSMEEKMIHVAGHWIGELFEKSLSKEDAETHTMFTKSWMDSSSNPTSTQVHGALSTLGVEGHQTAKDKDHENYREAGKKKEWLKDSMGQSYAFAQAYFKHIGLKEVSLYRGVVGDATDKAAEGDEVSIETRELSSFTSDPKVAATFGRPLKMKVPVANILWSNLNTPGFASQKPPSLHGESEIAVMGASSISGKILGNSAKKLVQMDGR